METVIDVEQIQDVGSVNKLFHDVLAQERRIQVCDPVYSIQATKNVLVVSVMMMCFPALALIASYRCGLGLCLPAENTPVACCFTLDAFHRWSLKNGCGTARTWKQSSCP